MEMTQSSTSTLQQSSSLTSSLSSSPYAHHHTLLTSTNTGSATPTNNITSLDPLYSALPNDINTAATTGDTTEPQVSIPCMFYSNIL